MADGRATSNRVRYFRAYAVGICHASVCTDMHPDDAADELNRQQPTGLDWGWHISTDTHFKTGEPHPCPCPDGEGRRHYVFSC